VIINFFLFSASCCSPGNGGAYPPSRPAHYSGLSSQARYPYVPPEQSALEQELEDDERFQAALDSSMAGERDGEMRADPLLQPSNRTYAQHLYSASAALEASSRQGTSKGGSRLGSRAGKNLFVHRYNSVRLMAVWW
jgi:hypothetical protein